MSKNIKKYDMLIFNYFFKMILCIVIGFMISSCTSKENYGKVVIAENQRVYEDDDIYFPHDYFMEIDMPEILDTTTMQLVPYRAVSVKKENDNLKIVNHFSYEGHGHEIKFRISKNLDITNVEYDSWTDMIDGSETKYTVEKVILSMNVNPFENTKIVGFYTLQIREDIFYADKVKYGDNDTVIFNIFNGKFKVYSKQER